MIKALIFDMDGLMIDSERLYFETEREQAQRYGKEAPEVTLWRMMGRKPIESMRIFKQDLDLPGTPEELLAERDELMLVKMKDDLRVMPGLMDILKEFYDRLGLAVATGAPQKFLDIALDGLGLRSFFDVLQSSDDIVCGKPNPEIYEKTVRLLELNPDECAVLEDSSNGALAGKHAGCYVIAVPSEYTRRQDFSFADAVVSDLHEARTHLKRLAG